jgi:hypothetical protein
VVLLAPGSEQFMVLVRELLKELTQEYMWLEVIRIHYPLRPNRL